MFKKVCFLSFFILFLSNVCFASYEDRLLQLESLRYGKSFQNESLSQRLLRLEEDYFGLSQSGDIDSRLNMLFQIAQNDYPNPRYLEKQTIPRKKSRIRNVLNEIASVFADRGVVTGFVPPMSVYDNNYGNYNSAFESDYYNRFFSPPKYSPNYVAPHSYCGHYPQQQIMNDYNSNYSTSNIQYDRYGYPSINNRDLYARSAVKILRD